MSSFTIVVNALRFVSCIINIHSMNFHPHLWVNDGAGLLRVDLWQLLCRYYLLMTFRQSEKNQLI